MRIGVLTYHDASNYGACLQAQATIATIEKYNKNVELIDYKNSFRLGIYNPNQRIIKSFQKKKYKELFLYLISYLGIVLRNKSFKLYRKRYFKISKNTSFNTKELNFHTKKYNIIISGSDQVWNPNNNGFDLNYLLKFANSNQLKISFSSSMTIQNLSDDIKDDYIRLLNKFDYLSVRELSTVNILKKYLANDIIETLDPVLLHGAEYWDRFASESIKHTDYDLHYVNNSSYFQNSLLKKRHIINIGSFKTVDLFRFKFKIKNHYGPGEFIYLIKNASTVFTTSFHAVIMCLIYNKPFFVHLTGNKGRDSRITNLLEKFELLDRAVYNSKNIDFNNKPDFSVFNVKIESLRKSTNYFLKNSLQNKS